MTVLNDRLYTVDEVADILKISRSSVYKLVGTQEIESTKVLSSLRIYGLSVNKYLEDNHPAI